MISQATESARQPLLQKMLTERDAVTGGLAQGEPGTLPEVQNLLQRALRMAQNG